MNICCSICKTSGVLVTAIPFLCSFKIYISISYCTICYYFNTTKVLKLYLSNLLVSNTLRIPSQSLDKSIISSGDKSLSFLFSFALNKSITFFHFLVIIFWSLIFFSFYKVFICFGLRPPVNQSNNSTVCTIGI